MMPPEPRGEHAAQTLSHPPDMAGHLLCGHDPAGDTGPVPARLSWRGRFPFRGGCCVPVHFRRLCDRSVPGGHQPGAEPCGAGRAARAHPGGRSGRHDLHQPDLPPVAQAGAFHQPRGREPGPAGRGFQYEPVPPAGGVHRPGGGTTGCAGALPARSGVLSSVQRPVPCDLSLLQRRFCSGAGQYGRLSGRRPGLHGHLHLHRPGGHRFRRAAGMPGHPEPGTSGAGDEPEPPEPSGHQYQPVPHPGRGAADLRGGMAPCRQRRPGG